MSEMRCDQVRDLLPERVWGTLDPLLSASVDDHLSACTACALERRMVLALYRDRPPVPADLAPAIRRALQKEREQRSGGGRGRRSHRVSTAKVWRVVRRPAAGWAAAAGIVLAAAATVLYRHERSVESSELLRAGLDSAPSVWLAEDGAVAGAPLLDDLSDLSDDELRTLLAELEG